MRSAPSFNGDDDAFDAAVRAIGVAERPDPLRVEIDPTGGLAKD